MESTELVRPDARKSLLQLREEWRSCVRCPLGVKRLEREGQFVFGQGTLNSIMLIGEGPGVDEEEAGVPFIGNSGKLLHKILALIGMTEFYMTNIVTCRSCAPQENPDGTPAMRVRNFITKIPEPVYKDEPPTPLHYNACLPRLHEEIYLVDPIVIVGLGGTACEVLEGGHVTITRDRGKPVQIEIPGASFSPSLTEKKEAWARKGKVAPTEQNMVRYHFIPTLHPAYVIRKLSDQHLDSPLMQLVNDLRTALKTYETYRELVYNILPTSTTVNDDNDYIQKQFQQEAQE